MVKRFDTCHVYFHVILLGVLSFASGCYKHSTKRIRCSFSADGIAKIVIRAAEIESAVIANDSKSIVEISGLPVGGTRGYHPSDPNWRETPPERWGFGFAAKQYGNILVISSKNEISYIHHHYVLTELRVRVPPGIEVIRQQKQLNDSGYPDLREP